ncbi:MAG: 30S ribosomal protein S19e [Thermoprotei archaeon]|nr:MAG: 30S ribosomal protein S19e [Thermoprotei archaeon]RLF18610.1 MAG: 30S ribosomal protein S19e [Thermoprotei archaeon]
MSAVEMVPPQVLIEQLAKYLKENVAEVKPPSWAPYVKTGVHKERLPEDPDWWYVRCAAILRKLYLYGPVGIERLRVAFGGRQRVGVRGREHFRKGSGAIVRKALQQLEQAKLVVKEGNKGRKLSPQGVSLLDRLALRMLRDLQKQMPELRKYLGK